MVNGPSEQPLLVRMSEPSGPSGFGNAMRGGPLVPAGVWWMCVAVFAALWYGGSTFSVVMSQQMISSSELMKNRNSPLPSGSPPLGVVLSGPMTLPGVASTKNALVNVSGGSTWSGVSAVADEARAPRARGRASASVAAAVRRVARVTVMVVPSS